MNKKLLKSTLAVAMVAVAGYGGYKAYDGYAGSERGINSLLTENVEALTQNESSDIVRFSRLAPVECELTKVNGGVAITINGVTIPAFAQYTVMGSKFSCEFNLLNRCTASSQTLCKENS